MSILLVDDHPSVANGTERLLKAMRLAVTTVFGVKELSPEAHRFVGLGADRTTLVEVDLLALGIKIALVDHQLGNNSLTGDALVPRLVAMGIFCLGIGDRDSGQVALLRAGAQLALRNKVNLSMAVKGELDALNFRWPDGFDVQVNGAAVLATMTQLLQPSD
jgi:hypothetical protein